MISTKPLLKIKFRQFIICLFFLAILITYKFTGKSSQNTVIANPLTPFKTSKIEIGAFVGTNPPTLNAIKIFENLSGQNLYSIMWFQGWDADDQPGFPRSALNAIVSGKKSKDPFVLHLTWEPAVNLNPTLPPNLRKILNELYKKKFNRDFLDVNQAEQSRLCCFAASNESNFVSSILSMSSFCRSLA